MANEKTYVIKLSRDDGTGLYKETSYSPKGTLSSQQGKINQPQAMSTSQNMAQMLAFRVGANALQYGLQNYGNLTGDYIGQQTLELVTGLASDVFMIAKGGLLGLAAVGIKYGTKGITRLIDYSKSATKASMLQERAGITNVRGW